MGEGSGGNHSGNERIAQEKIGSSAHVQRKAQTRRSDDNFDMLFTKKKIANFTIFSIKIYLCSSEVQRNSCLFRGDLAGNY